MDPNTPHRAEAERWLGISAKLLTARDFIGSKTFAIRAKESDPSNEVADQILAVVDTVLAVEKRVNPSQCPDWYTVMQLPRLVRDPDLIANHYRRLVLLLNPDRNRLPFADYALQMVMDAWGVLSDPTKKWLFDNELAVFLQRVEQQQQQHHHHQQQPVRVEAMRADVDPHFLSSAAAALVGGTSVAAAAAANTNSQQINTFQFFQPQPPPQPTVSMWQQPQQQQQHQEYHHSLSQHQHQHQQQQQHQHHQQQQHSSNHNQLHQIEFMQPPPQPVLPPHQQQLLPQWQMRDPTPVKGAERTGVGNVNGNGNGIGGESQSTVTTVMRRGSDAGSSRTVISPTRTVKRPVPAPPQPAPVVTPPAPVQPPPVVASVRVGNAASTRVIDGNVGNVNVVINSNDANNAGVVHEINDNNENVADKENDKDDDNGHVEEVESFWTSCPYCFNIYEYEKMYKDCILRCQNCRRSFHAVQIPDPPLIMGGDKDKESSSFCCWGFFPLGFSTATWKKQNQMGKANVASNWVPFSPMFNVPMENGGGDFQWFPSNGGTCVGPKSAGRPPVSTPRVYRSDDDDDFNSDPSDSDSSDQDWRRNPAYDKKRRKTKGRGKVTRPRMEKPPRVDVQVPANQESAAVDGVSVVGKDVNDGSEKSDIVVGLSAGAKEDTTKNKKVTASITKNQARRRAKNMGRLDLNVEFNNEGDEHAPTVSAVNREEDGIENIGFFEGLDEFLSTLPILNVGGEEKAKPS